jgi:hypothetical protein
MANEQDTWMGALGVGFARMNQMADETKAKLQSNLQAAQDAALAKAGASPETAARIKAAEQGVADFEEGRQEGRASGSIGLLNILPPVQLVKAGIRIAGADDAGQEALNIAGEKVDTVAGIGAALVDPAGTGEKVGKGLGKKLVTAQKEGHLAKETGNLVGHGEVIAATVAVTAGAGGVAAAGEAGVAGIGEAGAAGIGEAGAAGIGEAGAAGVGEAGAAGVGEAGAAGVGEAGAAGVGETGAAEGLGEGLSEGAAEGPVAGEVPPTVRSPGPEPFDPAPSANQPVPEPTPSEVAPTEPGEPPTLRSPGPEPFDPAPSVDDPTPTTEPSPPTVPTEPPTFRTGDPPPPESGPATIPEAPPVTQPFPPEQPVPEAPTNPEGD